MKNPIQSAPHLAARYCVVVASLLIAPVVSHGGEFDDFFSFNGSFEFGPATTNLGFYSGPTASNLRSYSTGIVTGWRLGGSAPPTLYEGPEAQDGDRYIGLTRTWNSGGKYMSAAIDGSTISHTPFTVGESYELTFWAAGGGGSSNAVSVSIGGTAAATFDLPEYSLTDLKLSGPQWQQYVLPFVATSSTLYLGVGPTNDHINPGYSSSIYLDNFSIAQAPEPGRVVLIMTGGVLLLGGRRRHHKNTRFCPDPLVTRLLRAPPCRS